MSLVSFSNYQKGVSLIEILVTTLILGIGLLGVASLQIASVSSNQEGFFYSQATSISDDMASRIRSSKMAELMPGSVLTHTVYIANYAQAGAFACGALTVTTPSAPTLLCRADQGAAPDAECSDGVNDLADIAAFDKWDICKMAQRTLPDGKVRVISSGWRLSVVVDWEPSRAREDLGQLTNVNSNCANAIGIAADRNCVITEILP